MSVGRIAQISVSRGGVPKLPVLFASVRPSGLEGDGHRDIEHHGGPDRAVCLFALEAIDALAAEGHSVRPGALGENITVEGLDWTAVLPSVRLRLGDAVLLEVTRYTTPCATIRAAFVDGEYSRIFHRHHPGWSRVYARVLTAGMLRPSDPVRLLAPRNVMPPTV